MTDELEPPALADQRVDPYGWWSPDPAAAAEEPRMLWNPAADYEGRPRGPLLPQPHETGTWVPGRGESMTWVPTPTEPAPNGDA